MLDVKAVSRGWGGAAGDQGEEGPFADAENVLVNAGCWLRGVSHAWKLPDEQQASDRMGLVPLPVQRESGALSDGHCFAPGLFVTLPRSPRERQDCPWAPGNGLVRPRRAWSWLHRFLDSWLRWPWKWLLSLQASITATRLSRRRWVFRSDTWAGEGSGKSVSSFLRSNNCPC